MGNITILEALGLGDFSNKQYWLENNAVNKLINRKKP